MTQLRSFGLAQRAERKAMQTYFMKNKISLPLSARIMNYALSQHQGTKARTNRDTITTLCTMPEALRKELSLEVFKPILSAHPLFKHLFSMNQAAVRQVTHTAISDRVLAPKEELFTRKMKGTQMYFCISGRLHYRSDRRKVACGPGALVSEVALWIEQYLHRGVMSAQVHCEVVCLSAEAFRKLVKQFMKSSQPHIRMIATFTARYAMRFLRGVDENDEEDPALQLTDIWFDSPKATW